MGFKIPKRTIIFISVSIVLSAISLTVFYNLLSVDKKLKIYNPVDVNPRLVDPSIRFKKINHKIADFSLINQNGDTITNKDYDGKIYVADFFFTRCQSICIPMAYNMGQLQAHYKNDPDIMFLSHSVTPVVDSVSVLKKYAEDKGVIDGKWNVTTGDKKEIYRLARRSYFAVLDDGDGGEDDFIHTEQFILVDKDRRIRGFYDGTKKEDMKKIISDISLLKEEYAKK